jgi:hypothetical protein
MGVVSVFCSSLKPQSMETKLGRKVYDLKVDRKYTKKQEAQRYIKKGQIILNTIFFKLPITNKNCLWRPY